MPRLAEFVAVIRRAVDVVAIRACLPLEDLADISLALGEACNQAVAARAYQGAGDILRLRCCVQDGAAGSPGLRLRLEAPEARFYQEDAAGDADAEPGGEGPELIPFSRSLIAQLMEKGERAEGERGAAVTFMRRFLPRAAG